MARRADPEPGDARARHDLEARVYGSAAPLPADVEAMRALLARDPAAPADTPQPMHAPEPLEPSDPSALAGAPGRPRRRWIVGGVAAVVLAGAIGASLGSSILRPGLSSVSMSSASEPTAAAGGLSAATDDYRARSEDVSHAEAAAAEYFSEAQDDSDVPGIGFPGVIASTTRRVLTHWGQTASEPSVWVARGSDGGFCLIATMGSTGSASCTPLVDVLSTGVRLEIADTSGSSVVVHWDLSSGLLEMTPVAGTDGATPPTP